MQKLQVEGDHQHFQEAKVPFPHRVPDRQRGQGRREGQKRSLQTRTYNSEKGYISPYNLRETKIV